jgi:hypothetical protein
VRLLGRALSSEPDACVAGWLESRALVGGNFGGEVLGSSLGWIEFFEFFVWEMRVLSFEVGEFWE